MKLLLDDGMQVKVGTGIGKYTQYLYETLLMSKNKNDIIELHSFDKKDKSKIVGRYKYIKYINSSNFLRKSENFDIVHFTNYAIPFRRSKKDKYVVTIHDLAAFYHPETFSKKYALYSQYVTDYAIKHSDLILTVSNSSRIEICERWPRYANRIKYIYPGVYTEFMPYNIDDNYESLSLHSLKDKKFFLFVGTIEKRKNLGIVINAFIQLKKNKNASDFKLVLAGRSGFGFEEYKKMIDFSSCAKDIIVTGYLPKNDINRLYQHAAAYLFPTVYEGFGSTQLECMCNHLPLILSDIPTNKEVSKEYGLYFQLDDIDSLIYQMECIVYEKIDRKTNNSIADRILPEYTWENAAKKYMAYISQLLRG